MNEYIDIYIDTTTKVPEDATEFDHELFERFMSGGPWVAHSEYMKLKDDNAKLRELVRDAWGNGHPDKSCGDCEIMDECHAEIEEAHKKGNGRWNTRCLFERRIENRMRELGVDV